MSSAEDPILPLRRILRTNDARADEQWRSWATLHMRRPLTPSTLVSLWYEILEFDVQLAQHIAQPVPVPDGTVLVAGSGKEGFKTFNVSTAAAILAAATGVPVVKGVSRSVSAVSGATDVLESLGITPLTDAGLIPQRVAVHGIAFVSYDAFCPQYARRYDGVFEQLTPLSFFMPIAVLAARASGYVYGLAHQDVDIVSRTLQAVRPDLLRGQVVATELTPGEFVDEYTAHGQRYQTVLTDTGTSWRRVTAPPPDSWWREAVAHGDGHTANATALCASLEPVGDTPLTQLVEQNAALIVGTATREVGDLQAVREARISGRAQALLASLRADAQKAVA